MTIKQMLPKQQEAINAFVEDFKSNFSGSDDYESGVNDALWSMLNLIITDDSHIFEHFVNMRYEYASETI